MTTAISQRSALTQASLMTRGCRAVVFKALQQLKHGYIEWIEDGDEYLFGELHHGQTHHAAVQTTIPGEHRDLVVSGQNPLHVRVVVHDLRFYQKLALEGSVGAGEAYMNGWWHTDQLVALVQLFARNSDLLDQLESGWARLSKPALKYLSFRQQNTKAQAKQNIAAHYDVGNDLYQLMLDPSMMYSSAIYPTPTTTLAEAQQFKLQHLCEQLQLQPSDHLLEIGTGWGSLAIYAAKHFGCQVTTTTISEAQYQYAKAQIHREGLTDKITLLKSDYRDLTGHYDKLVSIEMIEAVGERFMDQYFAKCASLLKPQGLMVLQAITIADQRFDHYLRSVDFIQKFIFPGGFLPSVHRITQSTMQHTDLIVRRLQDIGYDYARTLHDWRSNMEQRLDAVRQLGYSERFIRMWRFYLCYCEGGFLERATSTVQLVLTKPACRLVVR